jgi:hypothetical protein
MNLRIAIPLTMIVSFALTCVISLWETRARDQSSGDRPVPARENGVLAQENRLPAVELPSRAPPPAPVSAGPVPATTVSAATSQSPEAAQDPAPVEPNQAKTELPVEFLYQRLPDNRQRYVLTVMNKTEKAMSLDLTIVNPTSGNTAEEQVALGPMQSKQLGSDVGSDAGLDVEMGDRITLHNPSYNDMVRTIPVRTR